MQQLSTASIYDQSLTLLNDFYQLSMIYGYWKAGLEKKEAVFQLFLEKPLLGEDSPSQQV